MDAGKFDMASNAMPVRFLVRCTSDGYAYRLIDRDGGTVEESGAHWESSAACERSARFILQWRQTEAHEHA